MPATIHWRARFFAVIPDRKRHQHGACAADGSEAGECPEWQRELTVNQPPHGFAGSSPASPTILISFSKMPFRGARPPLEAVRQFVRCSAACQPRSRQGSISLKIQPLEFERKSVAGQCRAIAPPLAERPRRAGRVAVANHGRRRGIQLLPSARRGAALRRRHGGYLGHPDLFRADRDSSRDRGSGDHHFCRSTEATITRRSFGFVNAASSPSRKLPEWAPRETSRP